ncbi:hypothetical protein BH09MYX1_BH09MYX1_54380 [soil metagenome]
MKKPIRSLVVVLALASGATAVACADLFHSTDSQTLCDVDANAPGCAATTDAGALVDLCATDHVAAEQRAIRACAWLAACESPIGKNATGECMVEALLAYDCVASPNRKPKGKAKAFWAALATVTSCTDVARAVFPDSDRKPNCTASGFLGCSKWSSTINLDTRVACSAPAQPAAGENCTVQGRTCDSFPPTDASLGNNGGLCLGVQGRSCVTSGCNGAQLSVCDDAGLDRGVDCSQFGGGNCLSGCAQPACMPGESVAKAATLEISCSSGGVAQSTMSGFLESVDCTYISGGAPGNCTPISNPLPGTSAAAACRRSSGCGADACDSSKLSACVNGRTVTIDCVANGLKPCNDSISTSEGPRAACTKP